MSRRIISKDGSRCHLRQCEHHDHDTAGRLTTNTSASHFGPITRSASKEKKVHGHNNSLFSATSATRKLLFVRYYLEKQQNSRIALVVCLVVVLLWMVAVISDGTALLAVHRLAPIPRVDLILHKPRTVEVSASLSEMELSSDLRNPFLLGFVNETIEMSPEYEKFKHHLEDSKKYKHAQRDPLHTEDCEPMHPWQETSFPSCSKFHEMHLEKDLLAMTNGGYNSIFRYTDIDGSYHIMKILKYETQHTDRNFDRVRRDSLIMERATASNNVVDIYSYCGFSQVVELGRHGSLDHIIHGYYEDLSQEQKLEIAIQVAQGLEDVHDIDGDGISSMSHGDFASKQFILIDGHFKLNDFNRGRFIRWNPTLNESCPYHIGKNGDTFRAPEEYKPDPLTHKLDKQTAAIDVWALGSLFVQLVTGEDIWHKWDSDEARHHIAEGTPFPMDTSSTDPIDQVLFKAIEMCHVYDYKDRPKAGEVLEYLKGEAKRLGVKWGGKFGA